MRSHDKKNKSHSVLIKKKMRRYKKKNHMHPKRGFKSTFIRRRGSKSTNYADKRAMSGPMTFAFRKES